MSYGIMGSMVTALSTKVRSACIHALVLSAIGPVVAPRSTTILSPRAEGEEDTSSATGWRTGGLQLATRYESAQLYL